MAGIERRSYCVMYVKECVCDQHVKTGVNTLLFLVLAECEMKRECVQVRILTY